MSIIPLFLDECPRYLAGTPGRGCSLLLLPIGDEVVGGLLARAVAPVTTMPPIAVAPEGTPAEYARHLRAGGVHVADVIAPSSLDDPLARFAPSDELLLVSARWHPTEPWALAALLHAPDRMNTARHLLAVEAGSLHTKELVQTATDGRVRRIQRYFDPVTWPFPVGVVASLVPVSCLLAAGDVRLTTLDALHRTLAERGVPSVDVAQPGACLDLADEEGALALAERWAIERGGTWAAEVAPRGSIAATARLVGPVVVGAQAVVEPYAVVIGPTVLGPRSVVGRGAVVAQCVLTDDARVPAGSAVHHRVVAGSAASMHERENRRHAVPGVPSLDATATARRRVTYERVRAVLEPPLALVALLALSPLLLLVAALVKLTSRGPTLYGAEREGKGGRPFRCLKFRSMHVNADTLQRALAASQEMDGPQFKMTNDPRVTPIGRWLRRLNLDELPQLVNVLRGEMSFVGPRPSPFAENQICVPWREGRLSVAPGISGLWQVCRRDRASGDFHQWIHYDLLYVRNLSFLVDLKIALATVLTLGGRWPVPVEWILGRSPRRAVAPALVVALALALTFAVARPARGQEREPGQQPGQQPERARTFLLAVGEEQQWASNVRFQRPGDPGDAYARVFGTLTAAITGRTRMSVTARGDATMYRTFQDLNHTSYAIETDLARRATPRLELGVAGAARTTLASDLTYPPTVVADMALYPMALERSQSGTGTLRYALSPLSRLTLDGRVGNTTFDTPSLVGGIEAAVNASVNRRLSDAAELSVGYGAERREFAGAPTLVHRVTGTLDRQWPRWWVRTAAGAVAVPGAKRGARVLPDARIELARTGHYTTFGVGYSHAVTATYGIGRLLESDEARIGAGIGSARVATLRFDVARGWATDPSSLGYQVQTTAAAASVVATIAPLTIEAGGFLRRRIQGTTVETRGVRLMVQLAVAGRSTTPPRKRGGDNEGERK